MKDSQKEFNAGYREGINKVVNVLGKVLNEGTNIYEFSKLSNDSAFKWACDMFKFRVKADAEAKEHANLTNLDIYKDDLEGFERQVEVALKFIENRKADKRLRKARNNPEINFLFENDKTVIVAPNDVNSSREAASFYNTRVNWCIAVDDLAYSQHSWKAYEIEEALYVYDKNSKEAWAITLQRQNINDIIDFNIEDGWKGFDQFETWANNIGPYEHRQKKAFERMLEKIGMNTDEFYEVVRKYLIGRGY